MNISENGPIKTVFTLFFNLVLIINLRLTQVVHVEDIFFRLF